MSRDNHGATESGHILDARPKTRTSDAQALTGLRASGQQRPAVRRSITVAALFAGLLTLPAWAKFGVQGFSWSQAGPYGTPARLSAVSVYQSAGNFLAASPEGGLW